ncbi:MAG: hypothetical protein AB1306_02730 [Nitrospirota bacterium]
MRKRKTVKLLLSVFLIFMVSAFIYAFDALADIPTVKGEGTLTSIEDDGSVIIDDKGYGLDPSATIMDRNGKSVSIKKLSLPAKVRFEYRYAKEGFIIVFIGEIKEKGDSPRRRR